MTLNHFDPSELDRVDPELDELAEELQSYAADASPVPPLALSTRILDALDAEPVPAGWRARLAAWTLFIATGMIFSIGLVVARFTGEDLLGKQRPGNPFDALFMRTVVMSWLVFAIAIPFFGLEPTSLPLTVGILAGLMWLPFGWIIGHWVGTFHAVTRTVLCLVAWYAFPEQRFVVIPAVIVAIYLVTIAALIRRPR